jgi:hypothetical protein
MNSSERLWLRKLKPTEPVYKTVGGFLLASAVSTCIIPFAVHDKTTADTHIGVHRNEEDQATGSRHVEVDVPAQYSGPAAAFALSGATLIALGYAKQRRDDRRERHAEAEMLERLVYSDLDPEDQRSFADIVHIYRNEE